MQRPATGLRASSVISESHTDHCTHTATCIHCARVIFRRARRIGDVQLAMMQSHILTCRPLVATTDANGVLAHCRIDADGIA